LLTEAVLAALTGQIAANSVGTRVLPDDGIVVRLTCMSIPHHGGLPLVGYAHCDQIRGGDACPRERAGRDLLRSSPDLLWIVLHPSRLGVNLPVLALI